jgi:hypothetical protein
MAPVMRLIPPSWLAFLLRRMLNLRAARNFVDGTTGMQLRFGRSGRR